MQDISLCDNKTQHYKQKSHSQRSHDHMIIFSRFVIMILAKNSYCNESQTFIPYSQQAHLLLEMCMEFVAVKAKI